MIKSYKSIETTIPHNSDYINYMPENTHAQRWILFNDSLTNSLLIKLNSLNDDVITIKAGEYFGDDMSLKAFFISNTSAESIPVRIRFGVVENT